MNIKQDRLDAGLVYILAAALYRRCPDHFAIDQAANWLRSRGYSSEADALITNGAAT